MTHTDYEVRRERGALDAGWLQARFSFSFGSYVHPAGDSFGPVLALNEDVVQPGQGFPMHPHRDLEIFMLPLEGAIAHADSLGGQHVVGVGEVLMLRAGTGIRHSQFNASTTTPERHLQLWIAPATPGLAPQVRWHALGPVPDGAWQPVAAPAHGDAPFSIAQSARVALGAALANQPLALELGSGEAAYLHVISGRCQAVLEDARTETLEAGHALAVRRFAGPARLEARDQRSVFLLVTFPASLVRRNRTSAAVRAGR